MKNKILPKNVESQLPRLIIIRLFNHAKKNDLIPSFLNSTEIYEDETNPIKVFLEIIHLIIKISSDRRLPTIAAFHLQLDKLSIL